MGHRMLGVQLVSRGQFVPGRQHLERAVALYDPTKHQGLAFTYGINPRVSALVTLSLTLQYLGFVDQASRAGEQGVEEARQSDHFNSLGVALHLIERWNRRMELELFAPIARTAQNTSPIFQSRFRQFSKYGEAQRAVVYQRLERMDQELDGHEFVAVDRFTIADILPPWSQSTSAAF